MALIWAILVVVSIVYALYELLNIQKRKRYPPGPKGLPILGHLHLLGKNPHKDLQKLAKKHGPIMYMRLGLVPTIVASSADAAEKVLKTYDHIFASRPHNEACYYLAYGQKNLIFAKHGTYWRNMRKLTTVHLLSNQKTNSFQSMRRKQVELMIESLKKEARDCLVVDLSAKVASLNADITCLMVFGKKYMDEDLDKRGFKAVIQELSTTIFSILVIILITTPPLLLSPSLYSSQWQRESINNLIEKAIMEADQKGIKVLSLGLLNQEEKLNGNGEVYTRKHPQLKVKVKVVDGSSIVVAVVL
ncbi:hypothetical protein K7X08_013568 [Anisodus acutangulus]|uniref:Cytochrome P450 n=1 Tax=Anisodus acutangulus TaxID=402998 RepID=A0A9Q1LKF8_9SOLA|nr:hypothetical protein K7X08_013568 [Anisodus acutangulus]